MCRQQSCQNPVQALKTDIIVSFSPFPLCLRFPLYPLLLLLSFRLFLFLPTPRRYTHLPHLENKAVVRHKAFTSLTCMWYGSVMPFFQLLPLLFYYTNTPPPPPQVMAIMLYKARGYLRLRSYVPCPLQLSFKKKKREKSGIIEGWGCLSDGEKKEWHGSFIFQTQVCSSRWVWSLKFLHF